MLHSCETKLQPEVQLLHDFTTTHSGVSVIQRKAFNFTTVLTKKVTF